ncbi:MAG: hypothetical protein RSF33_08360 [Hydrogenoanaerobacterium sp.]
MDKNQSIWGKYPRWYTTQDVELPRLAEAPKPTDPAEPQKCVEVFGSADWVLFAPASNAKVEVFNDIEGKFIIEYDKTKDEFVCSSSQMVKKMIETYKNSIKQVPRKWYFATAWQLY